jgi:hypothetical protein
MSIGENMSEYLDCGSLIEPRTCVTVNRNARPSVRRLFNVL